MKKVVLISAAVALGAVAVGSTITSKSKPRPKKPGIGVFNEVHRCVESGRYKWRPLYRPDELPGERTDALGSISPAWQCIVDVNNRQGYW